MKMLSRLFSGLAALALVYAPFESQAALTAGTIWQIQATATTGNVNGAGFNTANTHFPTDLTATSATGNAPVLSSATYSFVAGDVGAWVYIKSGTNWTPGWYKITSVSTGSATVNATIGAAIQISSAANYGTNAVAGIATTASPTSGTYGVDYSQQDTANSSVTDLASTASSTTLTSVTAPWTPVSVGNIIHLTTSGTGAFGLIGWYEIVSYNSAGSVVTDRTTNNGTALAAGTGQTGGAGRFNGLEDAFQAMIPASSTVWMKNGSYTFSGAVSTNSTNCGTNPNNCYFKGFNVTRGDAANGSNRPLWIAGANALSFSQGQSLENAIVTGTASTVLQIGHGSTTTAAYARNIKVTNTSTSATQLAFNMTGTAVMDSEFVSQNGTALQTQTSQLVYGNYAHDSVTCINLGGFSNNQYALFNLTEGCSTTGIQFGGSANNFHGLWNTVYGREAKMGTGILFQQGNASGSTASNNILYGLTTGVANTTGLGGGDNSINNDFFNNTTDTTFWNKGTTDVAVNPQFVGASQLTGTTATTTGSVLTDSGASFGVTDNVDYLHVTSGTGVTTGGYLITAHTGTTLTVNNALGSSNTGNVVYWVSHGHNFQIGTNLDGLGFPTFTNATGGQTVSSPEIGAVAPAVVAPSGSPGGAWTYR